VDTDEVYLTTKIDREKTIFLPFNLGYENGAGNPPNPMMVIKLLICGNRFGKKIAGSILSANSFTFRKKNTNKKEPLIKKRKSFSRVFTS
jgi:hypothetical protein